MVLPAYRQLYTNHFSSVFALIVALMCCIKFVIHSLCADKLIVCYLLVTGVVYLCLLSSVILSKFALMLHLYTRHLTLAIMALLDSLQCIKSVRILLTQKHILLFVCIPVLPWVYSHKENTYVHRDMIPWSTNQMWDGRTHTTRIHAVSYTHLLFYFKLVLILKYKLKKPLN